MLISAYNELSTDKNNEPYIISENNYENIISSYTHQVQLKESDLLERIKEIENLDEDWDGYGSCKIGIKSINISKFLLDCLPLNLLNKLSKDDIYPNPHGTITLEWYSLKDDKYIVSLEVGENSSSYYIQVNEKFDSKEYFDLTNTSEIKNFISVLNQFYQMQ